MDLLAQLNRAMEYIEEHISGDLTLESVSSVTMYSAYHFQRLFCYIADMPLSEYIRRRKMTLAAYKLQNDNLKIIDLAAKYGYDSADSFTRAFVKQHGITPSAARSKGAMLKIYPPLTFQIRIRGVQEMNWRIEEKESFEVFGIERVFGNDQGGEVPAFWTECHQNGSYEKLFDDAGGIRVSHDERRGVCTINAICGYRNTGETSFPYMLCAFKNDKCKTDSYTTALVPKYTWAIFRSNYSDTIGLQIPQLFSRAYSEWLPSSGYDKADGPDLEIYGVADNGKYFEEVWLPVIKK